MSPDDLKKLRKDAKIREKATGKVWIINKTQPEVIATRAVAVVNPMDWELIEETDQDSAGQRFSLEGLVVYDAHAKKTVAFEDKETADKMLKMLQRGDITASQLDWK